MKAETAYVGARGIDCVTTLTPGTAVAFKTTGIDFSMRYLGTVTPGELQGILDAGLAFMPVTYADRFDGPLSVSFVKALGLPVGVTVWLDVEGIGDKLSPDEVITKINAWAHAIKAASYEPGIYVGDSVPLTSQQLFDLAVVRYWRSMSMVPEPRCGFCQTQFHPTQNWRGVGVPVDLNMIGADYFGRLPTWAVGS
jgi:hypothetical protein